MSIPRIARIHFVYQFIILSLILCSIFYIEILPDKRFLFLAVTPVFAYQLLIFLYCTELWPLPFWLSWTHAQDEALNNQEPSYNTESPKVCPSEESKSPKEYRSPGIPRARLLTRNEETPDSVSSCDANTQTVYQNVSVIFKKAPVNNKAARRSDSTKSYVLKRPENRLEANTKAKESVGPYVARNWRSLHEQKGTKSQSNLRSPTHSEEETTKITSPVKLETLDESIESDSSDLTRSLSFPLRQRKSKPNEFVDNLNDINVPIMPAWNAIDYFSPPNSYRRRKSISTEAIDRELRKINSHFEQNSNNDFTKSMEIDKKSVVEPAISKRGLKPSNSFNKWKQGVSNYFTKTKRTISVDDKHEADNKKPFYKELLLSKDVFGQEKKEVVSKKSSPFSNQKGVHIETHSPSYISYDDYFS